MSSMPTRGIASFAQSAASTSPGTAMSTISGGWPGARVRGEPLERGLIQDRLAGARRRQQRLDGRRLAAERIEARVLRAVTRGERRGLVDAAVHDREVEPGLRERDGRALGHRRDADERDAARRARDALAQVLHGDLGERDAAFGELRAAADAAGDAQRFLEHEPQARPAEAELEAALLAVADLADDLGLADARRVEAGRRQEQVLRGAFALPRAQAPLGFAVRGGAARQQLERVAAQVLHRRAVAAREDQLDAIASREIGELRELQALREIPAAAPQRVPAAARTRRALRCRLGATRRRPSPTARATSDTYFARRDAQPSAVPGAIVTAVSRPRPMRPNANRFRLRSLPLKSIASVSSARPARTRAP